MARDRRPERRGQVDAAAAPDRASSRRRRGTVAVDGRPLATLDRDEIARRIAVVPQPSSLPFAATVESVVALGRLPHEDRFRGLRPADRAAVAAAIERVGLGRLVGRDVRELSLGERQLVLLAVAIAQAAPVIVLDEPTVHLDVRHQFDVMDLLADLNARDGRTIVTVIHDLHLAASRIPRIVVVGDGRIVADGPPRHGALGRAGPGDASRSIRRCCPTGRGTAPRPNVRG